MKPQLHLNLFIQSRGHHEASWRHPSASPLALTDIRYYQDLARQAEAGLFDSIFLANSLVVGEDVGSAGRTWLEPLTTLGALAVSTSRIGLIATASTTYTEPYNLARQFASLDHISNGRVGWNIVTSWAAGAARNYSGTSQISHADRYERAEEFVRGRHRTVGQLGGRCRGRRSREREVCEGRPDQSDRLQGRPL